ncbi:MAG: 30S ribosomal protein S17 [Proteobacteria bacterium]|jgi:small subunit ribosomal protein S17|nr:30S ribosomal protein S17 [Pseudomonadota bacterium]NBP14694.1 30S ribosomal protein S17 [bacterium]
METSKKTRRIFLGEVISDKMDKTIIVKTTRTLKHPIFGKVLKAQKNYKVHDEKSEAVVGDVVEFFEGRPLAKTKYMYLARVVSRQTV